jgi:hypothetical protein
MNDENPTSADMPATKRDGFFAVDARTWARVCTLGANPAAAYIVLARGTGPDNRTSSWSVNAVERYTGLSRGRARDALAQLKAAGVVRETRGSTFPRYDLVPAAELPESRPTPSPYHRMVLDKVTRGEQPRGPSSNGRRRAASSERQYADELVTQGWLICRDGGYAPAAATAAPDWVWLPNVLADGANGHPSPIELVRQTADALTVRLLVDCYSAHHLAEDGGLSRRYLWQAHPREHVGQRGAYVVWGFGRGVTTVQWDGFTAVHRREPTAAERQANPHANVGADFFRRVSTLERLGLVEWVPYVVESDARDAQPIHPAGHGAAADTLENAIGHAAHRAGHAMLTANQQQWAHERGLWLAPVPAHREQVQLVGVARLRYRPHTRVTAAWWARLQVEGAYWRDYYLALAEDAASNQPLRSPLQHQRVLKGFSTGIQ